MQNAGQQYGQGGAPSHQTAPFSGHSETTASGGSITTSLRQFRRKIEEKHPHSDSNNSSTAPTESHVARVAPHSHYPPRSTAENYRFPHQYQDYGLQQPVKYSEISEPHPSLQEHISPSVIQKAKSKEYMEMCNVQQQHMKPAYDHLNGQQNYPEANVHPHSQYMHKEPQVHPAYKPESQYFPKDPQYSPQMPHQIPKYNMPTQVRKYPAENDFLSKLRRIHPTMARSIMSDHHLQESQNSYQTMDQNRMYPHHQSQRYMNYPNMQNSAYSHGYVPYSNYPPSCSYNRPSQIPPRFPVNPHERSISPRRGYPENMGLPMNYGGLPAQKMPPNYSQYNAPEYAQHYQHRRAPVTQEYYQQHCSPAQYLPPHQMPPQEIPENRVTVSDSIKHYIENWADEDTASEMNQMESSRICKDGIRGRDDQSTETVYMISSSELEYIENGLITSESGIPVPVVTSETGQYIIKSGVSIENGSEMVRLVEKSSQLEIDPATGERVVNLHIMDPAKPDCMLANRPNDLNQRQPADASFVIPEKPRVVVHQNTVIQSGVQHTHVKKDPVSPVNDASKLGSSLPIITTDTFEEELSRTVISENRKETADKNCSPINLDQLEQYKEQEEEMTSLKTTTDSLVEELASIQEMPVSPRTIPFEDAHLHSKTEDKEDHTENLVEDPHKDIENLLHDTVDDTGAIVSQEESSTPKTDITESDTETTANISMEENLSTEETINNETDQQSIISDNVEREITSPLAPINEVAHSEITNSDESVSEANNDVDPGTFARKADDDKNVNSLEIAEKEKSPMSVIIKRKEHETTENPLQTKCLKPTTKRSRRIFSVDDIINNIGKKLKQNETDSLTRRYSLKTTKEFLEMETKNTFKINQPDIVNREKTEFIIENLIGSKTNTTSAVRRMSELNESTSCSDNKRLELTSEDSANIAPDETPANCTIIENNKCHSPSQATSGSNIESLSDSIPEKTEITSESLPDSKTEVVEDHMQEISENKLEFTIDDQSQSKNDQKSSITIDDRSQSKNDQKSSTSNVNDYDDSITKTEDQSCSTQVLKTEDSCNTEGMDQVDTNNEPLLEENQTKTKIEDAEQAPNNILTSFSENIVSEAKLDQVKVQDTVERHNSTDHTSDSVINNQENNRLSDYIPIDDTVNLLPDISEINSNKTSVKSPETVIQNAEESAVSKDQLYSPNDLEKQVEDLAEDAEIVDSRNTNSLREDDCITELNASSIVPENVFDSNDIVSQEPIIAVEEVICDSKDNESQASIPSNAEAILDLSEDFSNSVENTKTSFNEDVPEASCDLKATTEARNLVEVPQSVDHKVPDQPEVQYRNVIRVEESSVLLEIAGELVEINVNNINGKNIITVVPISDTAVVDFNDNYENFDNVDATDPLKLDELPADPAIENETKELEPEVQETTSEIIIGMDLSLEEEIQLDVDQPPVLCTKAAKKAYDCDLQIPSITTSDDILDKNRSARYNENDKVSSSKEKTKKSKRSKPDSSKQTKQSKRPSSKSDKQSIFRDLIAARNRKKLKVENIDPDDDEFVPFKELIKARKLRKSKQKERKNTEDSNVDSTNKIEEINKENEQSEELEEKNAVTNSEIENAETTTTAESENCTNLVEKSSLTEETKEEKKPASIEPKLVKRVSFSDIHEEIKQIEPKVDSQHEEPKDVSLLQTKEDLKLNRPNGCVSKSSHGKKKLSLEEYIRRKRKLHCDTKGECSEIKKQKIDRQLSAIELAKPNPEKIKLNRAKSLDDINMLKSKDCQKKKLYHEYSPVKQNYFDWEETQSPKVNLNRKDQEKKLCEFKGLILDNNKPKVVIDINDLSSRPSTESSEDEILQNYKEQVESKLNTLNIQIPRTVKPIERQVIETFSKSEMNTLIERFLKNEKLSSEEMEKIRKIISYKRLMQQLKKIRTHDLPRTASANQPYKARKEISDKQTKMLLKKVSEKKKSRFRNLYTHSDSESETDLRDKSKCSGDYSVVQSNCLAGVVPKLIIKRKPEMPLPFVRLERLDLGLLDEKNKKYAL
ncbi:uncharacterized protein [Diabrotica undecimpunctata]